MYRIAICDDEPAFIRTHEKMTQEILEKANIPYEITAFSSAEELKDALWENPKRFDILLLDILLDTENGIALAKLLRGGGCKVSILFVTSSPDFSLEGYSVYPVHYLLKPLQKELLMEVLLKDYENKRPKNVLFPIRGGTGSASLDSILYIEILSRQIIVHTTDRQMTVQCPTLASVRELVPAGVFLQCHKSFLVNMKNIKDVANTGVLLANGENIPVGRAFYKDALQDFVAFIANQ